MRDNHDRMPELLTAYQRDGQFFGAVEDAEVVVLDHDVDDYPGVGPADA